MTEARIKRLETIVLKHETDFRVYRGDGYILDGAIHMVAQAPEDATIFDILKKKEWDNEWEDDQTTVLFVNNLVKRTLNVKKLAASDRNLLNDPKTTRWEDGYRNALARFMAKNGEAMSLTASYYGWHDYDISRAIREGKSGWDVAVVLDVREDSWGEFEGTFTDGSEHSGVAADVVYANGENRTLRWEGTLGEIMKKLFAGI
jgi:hypothetical protein